MRSHEDKTDPPPSFCMEWGGKRETLVEFMCGLWKLFS